MDLIIGIDPGLDGALAAIEADTGRFISVFDPPTSQVKSGKKMKRIYLEPAMVQIFENLQNGVGFNAVRTNELHNRIVAVTIENVHAMPGQGVVSMFSMGNGFGLWCGIIAALRLPSYRVEPAKWKRLMGIQTASDKGKSIQIASRLFPAAPLSRKKDDGRAEALLLAEYCRQHLI